MTRIIKAFLSPLPLFFYQLSKSNPCDHLQLIMNVYNSWQMVATLTRKTLDARKRLKIDSRFTRKSNVLEQRTNKHTSDDDLPDLRLSEFLIICYH